MAGVAVMGAAGDQPGVKGWPVLVPDGATGAAADALAACALQGLQDVAAGRVLAGADVDRALAGLPPRPGQAGGLPPETPLLPTADFLHCVRHTPLVSVDLVVTADGPGGLHLLLGERANRPAQGLWFVPGGRIRKGEPMASAQRRLLAAELGWPATAPLPPLQWLGAYEHFYDDCFAGSEVSTHYVVLAWRWHVGALDAPQLPGFTPDAQHHTLRWWPCTQAQHSPLVHGHTRAYVGDVVDATKDVLDV